MLMIVYASRALASPTSLITSSDSIEMALGSMFSMVSSLLSADSMLLISSRLALSRLQRTYLVGTRFCTDSCSQSFIRSTISFFSSPSHTMPRSSQHCTSSARVSPAMPSK